MILKTTLRSLSFVALIGALTTACADDGADLDGADVTLSDTGTGDAATEETNDASDVPLDPSPDATPDATPDDATPDDATPDDARADVAPDAPDVAPDVSPDVASDVSPDVAPDASPDVAPDASPDVAPDAGPTRQCPPAGPFGTRIGDTVAGLSLTTCDGAAFSLHDLCDHDAAVVVGFAEWCPTCVTKAPQFGEMFARFAGEGADVAGVVIVTQDRDFTTADAADCARVEARFDWGVPVVYDPTQSFRIELTQPANDGALVLDDENVLVSTRSGQSVAAIEALVRDVLE